MGQKLIDLFLFLFFANIYLISCEENFENLTLISSEDYSNDCNCDNDIDSNQCYNGVKLMDDIQVMHENGLNRTFSRYVEHVNETFDVIHNLENIFSKLFLPDLKTSLRITEFLSNNNDLSNECLKSFTRISKAIRNKEFWAFRFLDSMGSLPNGILEGVYSDFGNYDECLDTSSPESGEESLIEGQYCILKAILPFPKVNSYGKEVFDNEIIKSAKNLFKDLEKLVAIGKMITGLNLLNGTLYRLGLCIPSTCSAKEVENSVNQILFPITRLQVEIGPKCQIKSRVEKFDAFELFSISVLSFLTFCVILSTVYEVFKGKNDLNSENRSLGKISKFREFMVSFSLITNTCSLFKKNTRFASLDTIRLLLIVNVFIVHLYLFTPVIGLNTLKNIYKSVPIKLFNENKYFFVRSPQIVDAFLTMSGLMMSYIMIGKLNKTNGKFNYLTFLVQRWIRFSVPLLGSFLFIYLLPLFTDGPIIDEGLQWAIPGCKDPNILATSFLYISNFNTIFPIQPILCNPPSWFLSASLQLQIIAPIFILLYYKKPNLGICATILAIILGLISAIAPQLLYNIKPYAKHWEMEIFKEIFDGWKWYHLTTNGYITSFFVGIIVGFLMRKQIFISRKVEILSLIISIAMIVSIYLWNNTFWRIDRSAPDLSLLLWYSFGKLISSTGFAWIFYILSTGRGGFLNRFLSWHGFQPLARLSFGIYLLHFIVVIHRIFSVKDTYVLTNSYLVKTIITDIMIIVGLSYVYYILIECPFNNILNIFTKPKQKIQENFIPKQNGFESNNIVLKTPFSTNNNNNNL